MNPFATGASDTSSSAGNNPFAPSGGVTDLNSSEGLLSLALQQGGSVSETAQELVHPTTSILSTIGSGFKNAFSKFVDLISIPNEVVAGVLSSKYSIGDAIKNRIKTSDVIFGDQDPKATTMQKVGSFLVRTATDIALDPLTYLTFGASEGILGVSSLQKITLGEEAAAQLGREAFSSAALSSDVGTPIYRALTAQANGSAKAIELMGKARGIAPEITDLASKELETILKGTIDAPLNMDFAKKAMTNMLEAAPGLAETVIDKGGIKYFGKTILSGQRIASALRMIPGMTLVDEATKPFRLALQAPFDSGIVKDVNTGKYVRLPEEFVAAKDTAEKLAAMRTDGAYQNLNNIIKGNKLTVDEAKLLSDNLLAGTMPADERLANAYKQALGFNEDQLKWLQESGVPVARRENFGMPLVRTDTTAVNFTPEIASTGAKGAATFERTTGKFIDTATGEVKIGTSDALGLTRKVAEDGTPELKNLTNPDTYKEVFADAQGNEYERFNATMTELKQAGFKFEDNAIIANAMRAANNAKVGATRRFIREAAQSFSRVASEAPEGWRRINIGNVAQESSKILQVLGKEGEDLVFHPMIAQELEKSVKAVITDAPTNDILKLYDKVQSLWKAGVTSVFPAFHGRNALSNVFQNFLDIGLQSFNPATHGAATQMVFYDKQAARLERLAYSSEASVAEEAKTALTELLGRNMFTDATGHEWSIGELRQTLKERGIAFVGGTGQIDVSNAKSTEEAVQSLFPESKTTAQKAGAIAKKVLPVTQDFAPFEAGRLVGSMIEDQAKLVNFMTNLRATGDVSHAAARTSMFLFDYGNLTGFEKTFVKRLIPFYTFTRKNLELQVKTLLSTPGRISAELTGLTNLGQAISGGKLTQEEYDALPDWIKSGVNILKSKKGSTLEIYGSLGTPIEQPFAAFQPNQFLGSISPLVRVPIEQATGYSWFQGKPLSDVTNAAGFKNAPQAVKDFIGYKAITGKKKDGTPFTWYVALNPSNMNIINNLPLVGRVMSSIKQMQNVDVASDSKVLQQLVGVRPYSFDTDQLQAQKELDLQNELKDLLTKAGVTSQFTRTYVPKAK